MSITLMAYPTAFLLSPEKAKNEKIKIFKIGKSNNIAAKNLRSIKVLTNLNKQSVEQAMLYIKGWSEIYKETYMFSNGLKVHWETDTNTYCATVSGCTNAEELQKFGEEYFKRLDYVTGRNVREIRSREVFYYTYETDYTDANEIFNTLSDSPEAQDVYMTEDKNFVTAKVAGDYVKYYRQDDKFMLEVEKRISIVNIGVNDSPQETVFRQSAFQSMEIKTNINVDELQYFLQMAGYRYVRAGNQTPLKTPYVTLNWHVEKGKYYAEFSGMNQDLVNAEANQLFKSINTVAGRDVRVSENQAKTVYTYNTNYTDKEILINTLTEHGASDLKTKGGRVSCRLFDMDMVYTKGENNAFVLEITRVTDVRDCENLMNDLNDEYGLNIQEMTYNKIKQRLEQENMRLEDETVLEDNSIVLTIDVG